MINVGNKWRRSIEMAYDEVMKMSNDIEINDNVKWNNGNIERRDNMTIMANEIISNEMSNGYWN